MTSLAAVDFETFQRVLNRPGGFRDPGDLEEYCRGFQVFDKDMTGYIGVGQLKYILTNLGEKMSEDEVDELLKTVDTSSGQVNYTGVFDAPLQCGRAAVANWFDAQSWYGRFLRTERSLGAAAWDTRHTPSCAPSLLLDGDTALSPWRVLPREEGLL